MPTCPACGAEHPAGARFCPSCGTALDQGCPTCGAPIVEGAVFCSACGTRLAPPPSSTARTVARAAAERKVVTVLFADLAGSTGMAERLDPERTAEVLGTYFEAMRAEAEAEGGRVEKFIGDAVMAVFGVPVVHEDDALRAVRAAAGLRDAMVELGDLVSASGSTPARSSRASRPSARRS